MFFYKTKAPSVHGVNHVLIEKQFIVSIELFNVKGVLMEMGKNVR